MDGQKRESAWCKLLTGVLSKVSCHMYHELDLFYYEKMKAVLFHGVHKIFKTQTYLIEIP